MNDDAPGAGTDEPQTVSILFREPFVRPGTPEAEEAGCRCLFESNMAAAWLPVPGHEDETIMVINKDCPLHKIISKPMDDALGDL